MNVGPYEVLEVLGHGPLGVVYKARRSGTGAPLALKVMTEGRRASTAALHRFLAQARKAAELGHPGIVRILEVGADGKDHYVAMDWIEGGPLRHGAMDPEDARRICAEAADHLQQAHDSGIVHRNLKPSNILLDARRRPLITDFGMDLPPEDDEQASRLGGTFDAPVHRSPEQVFGSPEEVDARSDVFSLASILYEAVTGRPPFDGADAAAVLKRIELEDPAPPSSLRPGLGKSFDEPILRALEKDPAKRTPTAKEFARHLRGELPHRTPHPLKLAACVAALVAIVLPAVHLATRATNPGVDLEPRLRRTYDLFVRHGVIEGNSKIPYLSCVHSPELRREIEAIQSLGASGEARDLAEAIRDSIDGRFRDAEDRLRDCKDPRASVIRRNARLRLPPGPAQPSSSEWPEPLLAALEAVRTGRVEEALKLADAMVARPAAAVFLGRAVVMEHLGRIDLLQEALQRARAADPDDPFPVCYGLAVKVSCQADLESNPGRLSGELLGETVPLLSKNPGGPAPFVLLGIAHIIQGNRILAEESFAAARDRAPNPPRPPDARSDPLAAWLARVCAADERFRAEGRRFLDHFHLTGATHGPKD